MYCTGAGVVRNLAEAVKWYRRSAEQGDRYAQYNLAVMLLKGQGTAQDAGEAFHWCHAAAEQGLPEAQLQLADFFATGLATTEDPTAGRAWYKEAAAQGNPEAAARLHTLQERDSHTRETLRPAERGGSDPFPGRAERNPNLSLI
jgi:TPR repeat protein